MLNASWEMTGASICLMAGTRQGGVIDDSSEWKTSKINPLNHHKGQFMGVVI